jgi:hypothetical protein
VTARGVELYWLAALAVLFIVGLVLPNNEGVILTQWFAMAAAVFYGGIDFIVQAIERGPK